MPPAHVAIEQREVPRLRDLLDQGIDVHQEHAGFTLLCHAVVTEVCTVRAGEPPHADMTVFLLSRGADPHRGPRGPRRMSWQSGTTIGWR